MGSRSSTARHIDLANRKAFCALHVDSDGVIRSVKHPVVWDESFAQIFLTDSDHLVGTGLRNHIGAGNFEVLLAAVRMSQPGSCSLRLQVPVNEQEDFTPAGEADVPDDEKKEEKGVKESDLVVLCDATEQSGMCTCGVADFTVWFIPPFQLGSEKQLARMQKGTPLQSYCVECRRYSCDGENYRPQLETVTDLLKQGHFLLHHVSLTNCHTCNLKRSAGHRAGLMQQLRQTARPGETATSPGPHGATSQLGESSTDTSSRDVTPVSAGPRRLHVSRRAVVIVESDADAAHHLCELVADMRMIPIPFSSASEAMRHLRAPEVTTHLVISDVVLPRISGTEFIRLVTAEFSQIPVLAVAATCYFSELAMSCGATAFALRKSPRGDLKRTILSLLGGRLPSYDDASRRLSMPPGQAATRSTGTYTFPREQRNSSGSEPSSSHLNLPSAQASDSPMYSGVSENHRGSALPGRLSILNPKTGPPDFSPV